MAWCSAAEYDSVGTDIKTGWIIFDTIWTVAAQITGHCVNTGPITQPQLHHLLYLLVVFSRVELYFIDLTLNIAF